MIKFTSKTIVVFAIILFFTLISPCAYVVYGMDRENPVVIDPDEDDKLKNID